MTRRLVLVGGGHAHVEVLRRHARRPMDAEVVLVSPAAHQAYSGMMPAALRGAIAPRALVIDLPALCRMAGARFVEDAATRVAADGRGGAVTTTGAVLEGDLLSLDVGAVAAGLHATPGALAHAHAVRPLARWERLVARVGALAGAASRSRSPCTRARPPRVAARTSRSSTKAHCSATGARRARPACAACWPRAASSCARAPAPPR